MIIYQWVVIFHEQTCLVVCNPVLTCRMSELEQSWVTSSKYPPVMCFKPKYRLGHPENYLFLLSQRILLGSKYPKKYFILFWKKLHWYPPFTMKRQYSNTLFSRKVWARRTFHPAKRSRTEFRLNAAEMTWKLSCGPNFCVDSKKSG